MNRGNCFRVITYANSKKDMVSRKTRLKYWKEYISLKYVPRVIRTIFFVHCIPKVSRVGIVLREKSWFSLLSAVKFGFCFNFPHSLNFTALVRANWLLARKTTPTRLTFVVRLTKNIYFSHTRKFRNLI